MLSLGDTFHFCVRKPKTPDISGVLVGLRPFGLRLAVWMGMVDEEDGDLAILVPCFFRGCGIVGWSLPNSLMPSRLRASRRVSGLRTAVLLGPFAGGSYTSAERLGKPNA